jgi:thiopeptide-type bacteriocin biosynthesis protein
MFLKSVFDTYEQEVERFGGPAGMALAERFFSVDSRSVGELLHHFNAKHWSHDRSTMVAISIDDLLGAMGLSEAERLRWYSTQATLGRTQTSDEYRQRKNVLRALLGKPDFLATEPGGTEIARIFRDRRQDLADVIDALRKLESAGELSQSFDSLCASFVHLHVNRMGSADSLSEQWLLSLLHRTREGLKKAPATPKT